MIKINLILKEETMWLILGIGAMIFALLNVTFTFKEKILIGIDLLVYL